MRFKELLWIVQAVLGLSFLFADGLQVLPSLDLATTRVLIPDIFMQLSGTSGSSGLTTR